MRRGRRGLISVAFAAALISPTTRTSAGLQDHSQAPEALNPRIVVDDVGRKVEIPADVNRIVTLAPNVTEIVYTLGLGSKLVGDTNECNIPPAAKSKPHVGEPQSPSIEAILALHPDLVLATDAINRVETADTLRHLGIAVYTMGGDTETVLHILDSIGRVAELTGAEPQGGDLVAQLRKRLDALHARLQDRPMAHVLFVVWEDPLITVGQNTFIADALRWAGAESVVLSKQNWPQISIEEVVRLQPDYIVFANGHGETATSELAELRARPVWRDLGAVELGHVVNLNEEAIRPSPGLVDAIEQLARAVHPEAFSEKSENRDSKYNNRLASGVSVKRSAECDQCAR